MTLPAPAQSRDAERSREAILEAATTLFAGQGFEATALSQIAEAAGVARATPSYFFGSKAGLWQAVLDRQNRAVGRVVPRALARLGPQSERPELIGALVDSVFEFFDEHPAFIRLVGWSQLQGNTLINDLPSQWEAIGATVEVVGGLLSRSAGPESDARQTVMSVMALCGAHILLGNTLGTPLGLDVNTPGFLEARKAHLKGFLTAALG
ncbi:TetR family transcriptional regulator (plasmid) [Deinococcus aetherius]|uniref:TetR family transcriptional regulator n=1 Tax=Deinococcus aetherius TaxID=200252 RepID=A0ABM8AJN0_9DEIO|nr:TetR/AcrR family transcriptional regulator [Deinococcus aetherius]BDP44038.1 TetR family transcriptional regulator [Deinococcus aetherius]